VNLSRYTCYSRDSSPEVKLHGFPWRRLAAHGPPLTIEERLPLLAVALL